LHQRFFTAKVTIFMVGLSLLDSDAADTCAAWAIVIVLPPASKASR
jgi:hypothetical protein